MRDRHGVSSSNFRTGVLFSRLRSCEVRGSDHPRCRIVLQYVPKEKETLRFFDTPVCTQGILVQFHPAMGHEKQRPVLNSVLAVLGRQMSPR